MSQLLLRIDELLLVETNPTQRAELIARQAGYMARVGRFEEARSKIAELRSVFADGRSGRVTAFIMLAEGLVIHYEQLGSTAADRIARAQLLGQAMRDREVVAITSAWRAHLEFEESKFELTARSLRLALQNAESDDHATRARCAIVLFNAFALCGQRKQSQSWFLTGRDHALSMGDQASLDALLHSKAVFGVAWLRSQTCKGIVDAGSLNMARTEISSARNLQNLTRVEAHANYINLCDARLQIMEGKFQSAKDLLMLIRNDGPYPKGHFSQGLIDLEIAYCDCRLNRIEAAVQMFASISPGSLDSLDVDDRLVVAWMTFQLAKMDDRIGFVDEVNTHLEQVLAEYDDFLEFLGTLFAEFAAK